MSAAEGVVDSMHAPAFVRARAEPRFSTWHIAPPAPGINDCAVFKAEEEERNSVLTAIGSLELPSHSLQKVVKSDECRGGFTPQLEPVRAIGPTPTRQSVARIHLARPNSRNAVLEAGMKLFTERGFNGCSVQDITEAAVVPKGSFYNHFKSKEALAAEIVTEYGKGSTDRSILNNPEVPALTRLKRHFAALNEYFSRCNDGCLVGKFMAEVSDETPLIREMLLSVLNVWGEQISAAIAEGQEQGTIRTDLKADDLAAFLIDSYEGAILRTRVEKSPKALKYFVKVVFSSIIV